jgi:hypothetical protein
LQDEIHRLIVTDGFIRTRKTLPSIAMVSQATVDAKEALNKLHRLDILSVEVPV